jgi:hypothetical protein
VRAHEGAHLLDHGPVPGTQPKVSFEKPEQDPSVHRVGSLADVRRRARQQGGASKSAARSGNIPRAMNDRPAPPPPSGLAPAQLAAFDRDGYAGPFTALGPDEMAERYPVILRALLHPSPVYGFRTVRDHHLSCRTLFEICRDPAVVERVAGILGPDLLLWRSSIFRKLPGAGRVIWHQEHDFRGHRKTPALDPPRNLTAWLAFTEATRKNGCVQVFPASHRALLRRRPVSMGTGLFGRGYVFENPPEREPVHLEAEPGQFYLFDELAVHGSDPNTSGAERSGISIRYTPTSTRIHQGMRVDGQGLPLRRWHAILVRGRDGYGHNKLGPPPARDLPPMGRIEESLGALRHRWLRLRHGTR